MAHLRVALALMAMPVASCVSMLPPADAEIAKQIGQAVDSVNEIAETASIPYADRTFKGLQPHYVRALASLRGAKTIAEQREAYARGRMFHRPARISVAVIDNCIGAINALMEINRTKDLETRDLEANPVRATCTVPKLIEGDLSRGG